MMHGHRNLKLVNTYLQQQCCCASNDPHRDASWQTTNQIRDRDWTTAIYEATELQRRQTPSVTLSHSDFSDISMYCTSHTCPQKQNVPGPCPPYRTQYRGLEISHKCMRLKCDGSTRAETRFRLSAKRTSPNRRRRQFSRLPAAEVCASAVVMLDTPCSEVV